MPEFIYQMSRVRKAHGDKVILDDVTLSFLPGAKIGVVGPNGAGKSSVLRIMAGLDKPNNGDAFLATGATVGANAVVPNGMQVPAGSLAIGVPATIRPGRSNQVMIQLAAAEYVANGHRFRELLTRID